MSHHDVVENDIKKELLHTLIGSVAFLAIVALVGVTAFMRPAGQHFTKEQLNASTPAVTETATATAAASTTATAKAEVVEENKEKVASAAEKIEANTDETVDVQAPIASATN